jgi:ABC transporter substrate binding protein
MPAMAQLKAVLTAAQRLNVTTEVMEVKTPAELDVVFETAAARRRDGQLMLTAPLFSIYSKHIAELTRKHRLPAISMFSSFARAGGLMAYGPNLEELYREVGVMTGKILKGTRPADLPAESPFALRAGAEFEDSEGVGPQHIKFGAGARRRGDRIRLCDVYSWPLTSLLRDRSTFDNRGQSGHAWRAQKRR